MSPDKTPAAIYGARLRRPLAKVPEATPRARPALTYDFAELRRLAKGAVPQGARLASIWLEVRNDSTRLLVDYEHDGGRGPRETATVRL